jgi:hypothetical protein
MGTTKVTARTTNADPSPSTDDPEAATHCSPPARSVRELIGAASVANA